MKTSCCQSLIKSAKKFNMSVFCFGHLYSFFIAGVGVVHTLMIFLCVHKWWSRYNALINKGAALLLFCCWGVANGNCETLRDGETSVFLCEPETFWLFRLRHRDFKVFWARARDVQTFKFEPQIWLRAMRMSLYKSKPLYEKSVNSQ